MINLLLVRSTKIYMVIALVAITITCCTQAAVISITHEQEFRENVTERPLVVAYFYYKNSKDKDPLYEQTTKMFERVEQNTSETVRFIKINVERPALEQLRRPPFSIARTPEFLLFKKGKIVARIHSNQSVNLIEQKLYGAINTHFGTMIDSLEEQIRKARQYKREHAPQVNVNWGFGYPFYGYPYYGYPFYGPYYSPYYAPYGGIGFGFGVGF